MDRHEPARMLLHDGVKRTLSEENKACVALARVQRLSQSRTGWRLITVAWGDENLALSLSCSFLPSFTPPFSGKRVYEVKRRHSFYLF